jgi:hypothetical protein
LQFEAMTTATSMPSRAELEGRVRSWIDACVWRQEVHRAETGGFDYLERDEIERMGRKEAAELEGLLRFAAGIHTREQQAAIARALEGSETADRFRPVLVSAEREIGASLNPATTAGRLVERTVLRGYATLLHELRETVAAIPRTPAADAQKKPQPAAFVFTAFWDDFEQHKLTNR